MSFKSRLKKRKGSDISHVRRKGIPKSRSRAVESPDPHGGKMRGGDRERKRRRGSKTPRWNGDLNQIRAIWRGEMTNSLTCIKMYFKIDAIIDREPMKLL